MIAAEVSSPNQCLIDQGEDPRQVKDLESKLKRYVDQIDELTSNISSMSFEEFMEQEMNSIELLNESQRLDEANAYKRSHPITMDVAKLLFGPKKYDSLPYNLPREEYAFVEQRDVMMHSKHTDGCEFSEILGFIKEHREGWCGKRVEYRQVDAANFSWLHFKSKIHPIVRTTDNILVQYTVYQKSSRSEDLIYLFCETFVLGDRSDDHDGLRGRVRLSEFDFGHYGGFTEFTPKMLLQGHEDVRNFRKLIFEGEVGGDQTHRIPKDIVLKLGFHDPEFNP